WWGWRPIGRCRIEYDAIGSSDRHFERECVHARGFDQRGQRDVLRQSGNRLTSTRGRYDRFDDDHQGPGLLVSRLTLLLRVRHRDQPRWDHMDLTRGSGDALVWSSPS